MHELLKGPTINGIEKRLRYYCRSENKFYSPVHYHWHICLRLLPLRKNGVTPSGLARNHHAEKLTTTFINYYILFMAKPKLRVLPYPVISPGVADEKVQPPKPGYRLLFFFFATLASILALGLGLAGTIFIPLFNGMFTAFKTDLPKLTLFVLRNGLWLWAPLAVAILLWIMALKSWSRTSSASIKMTIFFSVLLVIEIVLYLWLVIVLYKPIFKAG